MPFLPLLFSGLVFRRQRAPPCNLMNGNYLDIFFACLFFLLNLSSSSLWQVFLQVTFSHFMCMFCLSVFLSRYFCMFCLFFCLFLNISFLPTLNSAILTRQTLVMKGKKKFRVQNPTPKVTRKFENFRKVKPQHQKLRRFEKLRQRFQTPTPKGRKLPKVRKVQIRNPSQKVQNVPKVQKFQISKPKTKI